MKLKIYSQSPKNKAQFSGQKSNRDRYKTEALISNINNSKNIDEVKKKFMTLSTKNPFKYNGKYFKKESDVEGKL